MAHVVDDGAREESGGDDAAEKPLDHRVDGRLGRRDLDGGKGGDEGHDEDPAELDPDLDAEEPGDGDADHRAVPWAGARCSPAATSAAAATGWPRRRRPASPAVPPAPTRIISPTPT